MAGNVMTTQIVVKANLDGVTFLGERKGDLPDLGRILDEIRTETAAQFGIPVSRLYWDEDRYMSGGGDYQLMDRAITG